ncbi:MAG TPA: hypothetical protein VNC19_02395, partial [Gemmatimonadales bacterium]|nr:hypothetical protein [Gemmatimonadales bacterium]
MSSTGSPLSLGFIAAITAVPLAGAVTRHPVPDVLRAMQQFDPVLLAGAEEPDRPDVHQRHFLEIQSWAWLRALELGLNFSQALRLNPTDQPDDRASLGGNPFDAQSHWRWVA